MQLHFLSTPRKKAPLPLPAAASCVHGAAVSRRGAAVCSLLRREWKASSSGAVVETCPSCGSVCAAAAAMSSQDENGLGAPCDWRSGPDIRHHSVFLKETLQLLVENAVFQATDRNNKVVEWVEPEDLKKQLDLRLGDEGITHATLLRYLRGVIRYSVKTGHPYFINQLFSSLDVYGLVGQWVTDALNPSVYTYEVAPVFTIMENEVLANMASIVGYSQHDGLFAPGGSMANMYGMLLARHRRFPEVKRSGVGGLGRLVAFTSVDAHYSNTKSAMTLGLGSDNLVLVNVDEEGRMDVDHLKECIARTKQDGAIPFLVTATAGRHNRPRAYDPLDAIADGQRRDVATPTPGEDPSVPQAKATNIHRSDSVTWNPHKLLAAPQQCSVFLTRHLGLLTQCNSASAPYLFQKDKFYDTKYDVGDKHLQCGRRADGTKGLERHIDHLFEMTKFFTDTIRDREGFRLVLEPQCTNVCFWYERLAAGKRAHEQYPQLLNSVAPRIKERMVKTGTMMITYQPLHSRPNFFRLVLQNSQVNAEDMKYFANQFEVLGRDL
ncbi:Cysteine sulfinic acid decarboxylase [Penaeus vannamei]|uniref:Cysteine sulfinic acid decarboxylase n=1 Tax=Penaeus vannamei TaxID=6689 RepID=A0A423SLF4_PENVA|nr:Cysteine sulfinic acid decarboxylase [Penaeus vannamei]